MNRIVASAVLVVLLAAFGQESTNTETTAETAAPPKYSGILVEHMDKEVRPGDDFNMFVNGGWITSTAIPAGKAGSDSPIGKIDACCDGQWSATRHTIGRSFDLSGACDHSRRPDNIGGQSTLSRQTVKARPCQIGQLESAPRYSGQNRRCCGLRYHP